MAVIITRIENDLSWHAIFWEYHIDKTDEKLGGGWEFALWHWNIYISWLDNTSYVRCNLEILVLPRAIIVLELKEYKTRVIRFDKTIKLILIHFYFVNLDKMNLSDNITKSSSRESNIYSTSTKRVNSLKAINPLNKILQTMFRNKIVVQLRLILLCPIEPKKNNLICKLVHI